VIKLYTAIEINTDYITLGQFVKLTNVLESGGMVKAFLQEQGAVVNGEIEHRRGRKLYEDDVVEIEGAGSFIVKKKD
jgi:ribosome-associated protein